MVPQSPICALSAERNSFGRVLPRLLQLLTVLLLIAVRPAWAKEHPVPLDKNVDAAKCLECHNGDDNREFGGTGANGPRGSKWTHLLERRYEFSQAPGPGQLITNLYPNLDVTVNGPFGCAESVTTCRPKFSPTRVGRSIACTLRSTDSVARYATQRTGWARLLRM